MDEKWDSSCVLAFEICYCDANQANKQELSLFSEQKHANNETEEPTPCFTQVNNENGRIGPSFYRLTTSWLLCFVSRNSALPASASAR